MKHIFIQKKPSTLSDPLTWIRLRNRVYFGLLAILCLFSILGLLTGLITGNTFIPFGHSSSVIKFVQHPITFCLAMFFNTIFALMFGFFAWGRMRCR